jgi:methyltransferase (TIGR00027 family)
MTQVIEDVSDTAFMVAGFRAVETERPRPLFRDPLAAKLAGDRGKTNLATVPKNFIGAWSVVIRTVTIDDFIRQAIADGVDTIVNLGAGLDTRPYRVDLPKSLRWIEVDFPQMIELRKAVSPVVSLAAGLSGSSSISRTGMHGGGSSSR